MIDIDLLTPENIIFIKQFSEDYKFCTPIKSDNGNIFYPISHEKLFLRYYISFTGDIYDNVTNKFTFHNLEDYAKFITTDTNEKIMFSIKDLVWRTYYKFPKVLDFLDESHIRPNRRYDDSHVKLYYINGIEFRVIKFPENSIIYKEFIENDKCNLIVSKDGAVFDITRHRFLKVVMDSSGQQYYNSKNGKTFKVEDFIIYGWYEGNYDPNIMMISSVSQHMIISNYDNLILIHKDKYLHNIKATSNIIQHCGCAFSNTNMERYHQKYNKHLMLKPKSKKYDQFQIDQYFGKLYIIPIEGMQNYRLTKCGIIYSITKKKILTPLEFIGKRNDVYDIAYFIPELKKTIMVSDLIIWTFYHLTRDSIAKIYCRILFDDNYNVPYIDDVLIICKSHSSTQTSYLIGNELFLRSPKSPNLYFSKNGAIYDSESSSFILITGYKDDGGNYVVSAPSKNNNQFIYMQYELYTLWIGHVSNGLIVIPKNGIYSDTTITNLKVTMNPNADYVKKCYPEVQLKMFDKIKKARLKEEKKLLNIYNVKRIEDIPKPYL